MIARNFIRFPEALAQQLELALDAAHVLDGINRAVRAILRRLPAGSRLGSVPFLRLPQRQRPTRGPWRACAIPGTWWWSQLSL